MYAAFVRLLNTSAAAGILIAVVIALRFLLRKAPKKYICILWALVALRLIVPLSISSSVSAYNFFGSAREGSGPVEYIYYGDAGEIANVGFVLPAESEKDDGPTVNYAIIDFSLSPLMVVWTAGVTIMALYAGFSYRHVRKQVDSAIPIDRRNLFLCDYISTPFILGILSPKIYLPSTLDAEQRRSVVAHERAHIARLDHCWKPLGFALLCLHWFNPMVWIAYALLCRDIEMACDEKVISKLTPAEKQIYSQVLLTCSMPRSAFSACPLAFGETGVKRRIRGILNYRKPTAWMIAASLLVCLCTAALFLTDPVKAENDEITTDNIQNIETAPLDATLPIEDHVQPIGLTFTLPQGFRYTEQSEITYNGQIVGGMKTYNTEYLPLTPMELTWTLDFPEITMENVTYYAEGNDDAIYSVSFFSDVPDGEPWTVYNIHYLYYEDNKDFYTFYDLWFDATKVDSATRAAILKTVKLDGRELPFTFNPVDYIQNGIFCYSPNTECELHTSPSDNSRVLSTLSPEDSMIVMQEVTIANNRWIYGYGRGKNTYAWLKIDRNTEFAQSFPVIMP